MTNSSPTPSTMVQHSLLADIYMGAVRGDFAPEMGGAGRLTQVILGFIPPFNSITAIRDLIADFGQQDYVGSFLNFLAIFPAFGGVPKLFAVALSIRRVGRVMRAARALGRPVATNKSGDPIVPKT